MSTERLEKLRAMLAKRETLPGYEENVKAIRAEIARLEAQTTEES